MTASTCSRRSGLKSSMAWPEAPCCRAAPITSATSLHEVCWRVACSPSLSSSTNPRSPRLQTFYKPYFNGQKGHANLGAH